MRCCCNNKTERHDNRDARAQLAELEGEKEDAA